MSEVEYDLVVIGSGPAGQKGSIAAAKARKRVAVIDRATMIGGVSVHTGTIPSKTIREAILQLTGFAVKALYGNGSQSRVDISIRDVSSRVNAIVARETKVIRAQLKRGLRSQPRHSLCQPSHCRYRSPSRLGWSAERNSGRRRPRGGPGVCILHGGPRCQCYFDRPADSRSGIRRLADP
jgi:NAD(P) transhydrogenase